MIVVVTGAQGFLGRHLVRRLAQEGYRVVAVDRRPPVLGEGYPEVLYHISNLSDPTTLIPPECEPIGQFALVHLAWDLRLRESSYKVQSEQVTAFAGILDYWRGRGLSFVIAPGSAQEYGARGGVLNEDALPLEPLSPYGWAKRAAHEMATSWSRQAGIGLLWLRPFIAYGPGQAGSMLIPYAVRCAREGARAEFTDGMQIRDFVYVEDIVDAILLGLRRRPQGPLTLNLGSRDPVPIREVILEIARYFGAEPNFIFGARPRRLSEPDIQVSDCTRAESELGWRPQIGWREGIRRVCEGTQHP